MTNYSYYVERVVQSIVTIFAVTTFSFFLMRELPGGPVAFIKAQLVKENQQITQRELNRLVEAYTSLRPDAPLHVQYVNYLESVLLHFDLGRSYWYGEPVADILLKSMPWTIYLSAVALFGGFAFNVIVGSVMAYKESSKFDTSATVSFLFFGSIPYYVIAVLLVYVFGFQLQWFPNGAAYDTQIQAGLNIAFMQSVLYHSALPIASLFIARTAGAIGMRANAIRVLGEDYLRVARLRGLTERRIATRYVARNAILPAYTSLMIAIGTLFGGSVILETIFAYPGVGYYTFQALQASDYPLMMGGFVLTTAATVTGVLIGDLTYGLVDPRAGGEDREAY